MGTTTTNGSSTPRKHEERELPVKLNEKELLLRGDEMAECELNIEALKIERLQLNKKIKAQIDQRGKLGHTIDRGAEDRPVRCEWRPDFAKNVFRLVRLDTQEEVDTRAMTGTDRQGNLAAVSDVDEPDGDDTPPPRRPRKKAAGRGAKPASARF